MFYVIPLGTSSALPTRERHLSATALWREGQVYLFDCGEGTQYRLMEAGLKRSRLEAIFITHLHGDHVLGLPGLLATLSMLKRREEPLTLVGPRGLRPMVEIVAEYTETFWSFEMHFVEIPEGTAFMRVYETPDFWVEARALEHRVFTVGYRFQEKEQPGSLDVEAARALGVTEPLHYRALKGGEAVDLPDGRTVLPEEVVGPPRPGAAFAYVTDTRPCAAGVLLARRAELVYHEATFTQDMLERARETGHATAREAAEVARQAEAGRLLLGHFSARYRDVTPLVMEAREVFPCTEAAEELRRYEVHPRQQPCPKL